MTFPTDKSDLVDNVDDAMADHINKIEDKIGIDEDTETSSLDYMLRTGWTPARETWEFSSVDDPTGVITVPSGADDKYSAGMRIKLTNGGNTIYGIITAVADTSLTFLHEMDDSEALHLLEDSAITNPYYSTQKAPLGFPLDPTKWRVEYTDTVNRTVSSPSSDTWQQVYAAHDILVPIGLWNLKVKALVDGILDNNSSDVYLRGAFSTSTSDVSDQELHEMVVQSEASHSRFTLNTNKVVKVDSKTEYFLIAKINLVGGTATIITLRFRGDLSTTILRAICAYL
jgi:hypothetical protein